MTTAVVVSTIVAVVSLFVSVGTAVLTQRMKHQSDLRLAERNARREYEYEARRRLYSEFEPLQFTMTELCETAYGRTCSPIGALREGRLAERYPADWRSDPYAMLSTVYELMAPLALFRIARSILTLSDLNLDDAIKHQYLLAKELYLVWQSGTDLAAASPSVPYDDNYYDTRQVPLPRHLDELLSALIEDSENARLIDFREYYRRALSEDGIPELEHLTLPFTDFHPERKRVLWRALIASAHICKAIANYSYGAEPPHPVEAIPADDLRFFQWRDPGGVGHAEVEDDLTAARNYLRARISTW